MQQYSTQEEIQARLQVLHRHQALLEEIQADETSERALRGIEETLKRVVHEIAALYVARQNITEENN